MSHDDPRAGLELARLIGDATSTDGHAPFGEHILLTLDGQRRVNHARIASRLDERLAGFLVLSEALGGAWYADLVTAPEFRGRGVTTAMLLAARDHVASHGGGCLRSWAYSHGPVDSLAAGLGMSVCRAVRYQQLPLAPGRTPVQAPPGVRLRTLGREEAGAWLALSNAAFAGHPENGGWTNEDLAWRLASPWTALDRFVVAADAVTDRLLGGVWTKVMPGSGEAELYVVAVHPDWTGRGVARVLVQEALRVLTDGGLQVASLYVDSDNAAALALYAAAGFVTHHEDRCFEVAVP